MIGTMYHRLRFGDGGGSEASWYQENGRVASWVRARITVACSSLPLSLALSRELSRSRFRWLQLYSCRLPENLSHAMTLRRFADTPLPACWS